jgi:hypothetical protein
VTAELAPDLVDRMADAFARGVMERADLPLMRLDDFRQSCEVTVIVGDSRLRLTCTITGSSYECSWDGREESALRLASEAAESTAHLVTKTRHYEWLRSRV